jgi:hypothetical protein
MARDDNPSGTLVKDDEGSMNYVPVNGLRILAVEGSILLATFLLTWSVMRFCCKVPKSFAWLDWLLASNSRAVIFIVAVSFIARGLLLPVIGIPEPRINDEYSYLLMADTFSHHRLTNPTPAAWQHFETFHVNVRPTYHSKYPVAQGLVLTLGQLLFHQPWVGVYLSTALLCGAICWTLQAFVPRGWALLGGVLAVVRIALFSYWANSYWGGSVAALGGALALGAVVRMSDVGRSRRDRLLLSCSFASGLLILATSRPYEGLAFSTPLFGYFGYCLIRERGRKHFVPDSLLPVAMIGTLAVLGMGYYNHITTGNTLLMPYVLNYRTYWPLPALIGEGENAKVQLTDPVFVKFLKASIQDYGYQKTRTIPGLLSLEGKRLAEDWFFYVGLALTFPVSIGLLSCLIRSRLRIAVLVWLSTTIALALCTYSAPHYAAMATIAVFVFATEGLRYLWQQRQRGERAFVIGVVITVLVASVARQTGMSVINTRFRFENQRRLITEQLEKKPGLHLVLVSYDLERHFPGNELVHNGADFNSAKILWARSKGLGNDVDLCHAYSARTFWVVHSDDINYSLRLLNLCK